MPDNETPIRTTKRSLDLQIYDNFAKPSYSLTDYAEKSITPYGKGEMAVNDTRNFRGGCLNLSAVPFQTASDVGVNDHLKYEAVSARTFPVPGERRAPEPVRDRRRPRRSASLA